MVNRDYLPYQSAQEHQDRGMMKWMGFFLSEHTSSLKEESQRLHWQTRLTDEEKWMLLNQLYSQQLAAILTVEEKHQLLDYHGRIKDLTAKTALLENQESCSMIEIARIVDLAWEDDTKE